MKKIFLSLFIFSSWTFSTLAQKQGNIWYFGWEAGLDFNQGAPVALTDGATYIAGNPQHCEAASTISDSSGSMLFYTNGRKVWNKHHQIMPHGDSLLGHWSSTQGALIVPKPGSSRYFYIFTTDAFYEDDLQFGFRYSVVDICLDNGLGDVITNEMNIKLLDTVAEKLTAIKHANGIDYWVITHKYFSNSFYCFLLTSNGIVDTVVTQIGSNHPYNLNGTLGSLGQMKASPNGEKIAVVNGNVQPSLVEYFDFDKSTGHLSNWVDLSFNPLVEFYGCSFSPDNSKLYVTSWLNVNGISQFNLSAGGGHPDSVRASRYLLPGSLIAEYGMQLGPDGKIYCTRNGNDWLAVINFPNLQGSACYLDLSGIYLNGKYSSYNICNMIDSYDYSNTSETCQPAEPNFSSIQNICPGTCTDFINLSLNATSYQWTFFGASPDTSTAVNPQNICYANPGSYDVQLIATNSNGNDTLLLTNFISVYANPLPQGILQSGDTLYSHQGFATYQWYHNGNILNGETNYFLALIDSGDFNVICTDTNGCEVEAAIFDVHIGIDEIEFGNEFLVYPNPVRDKFTIQNSQVKSGTANLKILIYNFMGEKVLDVSPLALSEGSGGEAVDCKQLPSDIYYLEIISGNKIFRTKFIKQ